MPPGHALSGLGPRHISLLYQGGATGQEIALLAWGMGTDADGQNAFLDEDTPCV
jgi:hypothetical protein